MIQINLCDSSLKSSYPFILDMNECEILTGGLACEDECMNTDGSFHCVCTVPGFELGPDGRSCIGIKNIPPLFILCIKIKTHLCSKHENLFQFLHHGQVQNIKIDHLMFNLWKFKTSCED